MVTVFRHLVFVLAFAAVLPWPQSCFAAGLDGWGARYAQAEQARVLQIEARRAENLAQGLVSLESQDQPREKVTDRDVAVELLKLTASLLVPGLGIVIWLAE